MPSGTRGNQSFHLRVLIGQYCHHFLLRLLFTPGCRAKCTNRTRLIFPSAHALALFQSKIGDGETLSPHAAKGDNKPSTEYAGRILSSVELRYEDSKVIVAVSWWMTSRTYLSKEKTSSYEYAPKSSQSLDQIVPVYAACTQNCRNVHSARYIMSYFPSRPQAIQGGARLNHV